MGTVLLLEKNNDNFNLYGRKEKAATFNAHTLIVHEIMCSKNAQCNTGE